MGPDFSGTLAFRVRRSVRDKSGHKVGSDFSHFLFAYGLRDILLIGLENVFKRAAISARASIPEQLDGWPDCQQEGDQDCSGESHAKYCNATGLLLLFPK
jgi:hypothetical protein